MSHTVGEVARITGVSIRTLHHYDEIRLLSPCERTAAGYRRYGEADLQRLRRILAYRALGIDLSTFGAMLVEPALDALALLGGQRDSLTREIARLKGVVDTLNRWMEARKMGINLDPEEIREVFGNADPAEHAAEAEQRWGHTDAYKESHKRTSSYTKEDWISIKAEAAAITAALGRAMRDGLPATDPDVTDLAEQHRQHISRWFYGCGYDMHRGLADMYTADARFAANYDNVEPGLSTYIRDAIHANADRAQSAG
jgi:MerR family transcriptional regulator, thiopeptide resistance regulator